MLPAGSSTVRSCPLSSHLSYPALLLLQCISSYMLQAESIRDQTISVEQLLTLWRIPEVRLLHEI
jgi:hypothetical protein